ncbi:MAG: hypothetical protein MJH11_10500 [Lentisphaeria bacterium]|nr:hypothetical protein [Lentisphaeria bacterium]
MRYFCLAPLWELAILQHFSFEQTPETEEILGAKIAHLVNFGVTAIWFERMNFDIVDEILRHERNELR